MVGAKRRWLAGLVGVCVALMALGGATAAAKTTVTVGIIWGETDPASAGFEPAAKLYEQMHPDIDIQYVWGTALADQETAAQTAKVVTLTAAGEAPDAVMVGGQSVPQYAVRGFLRPLDDFIRASGVSRDDFIPPAWNQAIWAGQTYALTLEVDPNFAMIWKKQMFGDAGLNPDKGPATLAEWESHFKKLTKIENGKVTAIGAIPWQVYGNPNTVFTWGWVFGGNFFDYNTNTVTADDPHVVEAVSFLRDYYDRYAPYLSAGAFPSGNVAMQFAVSANLLSWLNTYPDTKLGIGLEPYKSDAAAPNPAWIGGWALGISKSAQHPKEAWDFLRFITASKAGTQAFSEPSGWLPAYLPSPVFQGKYARDPYMSVYMHVALSARHQRPAMPAIGDYQSYLDQAFADVLAHNKQPKEALQFATQQTQRKLDEILGR